MVYVSKPVWRISLLCVQWKTPDDGQRNCPKQVEFYYKNKFEKLVHLFGFIIRIYVSVSIPLLTNSLCTNIIYMLLTFLTINSCLSLNNTNILLLMICTECVFCEMGTESVHALQIRFHRSSPSSQPSRTGRLNP